MFWLWGMWDLSSLIRDWTYPPSIGRGSGYPSTTREVPLFKNKYISQFSCSVVSDSFRPHESQHARPPCLSPTPGVHSDSHPSSQWCHPTISSSVLPFSSCPQSLPASESFPMSQLFAWDGQSTGVSALASFLYIYIFYLFGCSTQDSRSFMQHVASLVAAPHKLLVMAYGI